jgi:glycosyltransferase involved in cell wall biosynthesis
MPERVLISTIAPVSGGVPQMTRFVAEALEARGYDPVLAYYEPHSVSPELSVPSFRLLQRRVGRRAGRALNGYESHALGAWLPELEFTHYWPTTAWRTLIDSCRYHVSVSGNCLAATPYALTDRPFLAWVATPWEDDRKARVASFPWPRKLLDRTVNERVIRRIEKKVLHSGTLLALSDHTRERLDRIAGRAATYGVLPMPVDTVRFCPDEAAVIPGRIGFVGRYDDPRKNVALFLDVVRICRQRGLEVSADLIGGGADRNVQQAIQGRGLAEAVRLRAYADHATLPEHLRRLDVFVVPSHQEGLCIAALEAMACGCPVVSTPCGGPQEFVLDGETGYLCGFDAASMAEAIRRVCTDRRLRSRLSVAARDLVQNRYTRATAEKRLRTAFAHAFH